MRDLVTEFHESLSPARLRRGFAVMGVCEDEGSRRNCDVWVPDKHFHLEEDVAVLRYEPRKRRVKADGGVVSVASSDEPKWSEQFR